MEIFSAFDYVITEMVNVVAVQQSSYGSIMVARFSFTISYSRGAARGDIFARHLAAHQRIWN